MQFSFLRNKGKGKGLLSWLLAVYEMFRLCKTYRGSGSVLDLLISHIHFERDRLPRTFASRFSPYTHHYCFSMFILY